MELNALKWLVNSVQRGSIHTITYAKELKTRKGIDDTIIKVTTLQGRFGVDYENIGAVKEARASGIISAEPKGLSTNMRWEEHRYILKNEATGKHQLRVTRCNRWKPKTTYLKNGVPVAKEEIVPLCLASETKSYSEKAPSPILNIGIEKILKIK